MPFGFDWRDKLRQMLLDGSTSGVKQRDITHGLEGFASAPEILQHLEAWEAEEKVQQFKVPTKGRPGIVWRATTKLLEEIE